MIPCLGLEDLGKEELVQGKKNFSILLQQVAQETQLQRFKYIKCLEKEVKHMALATKINGMRTSWKKEVLQKSDFKWSMQ